MLTQINNHDSFEYITPNIAISNGDCLEKLQFIQDNSIDAVIMDPPYFIDGMGTNWDRELLNEKTAKVGVVQSMPVGMKFDPQQGKDLQDFIYKVSLELMRILKPGGVLLSFSQGRLYHRMAVAIEDAGFEIRDMYIWKRDGQAKAFSQDHFIKKMNISEEEKSYILKELNCRKTPQLRSTSEPIVMAQKPKEGTFVQNWLKYKVGLVNVNETLDGKFPSTIMDVKKPSTEDREGSTHLTIKPVPLLEHLIKLFTVEDAIILDPFMGSGTTGVAATNTSRNFIGIEIDNIYYNESKERIKKSAS